MYRTTTRRTPPPRFNPRPIIALVIIALVAIVLINAIASALAPRTESSAESASTAAEANDVAADQTSANATYPASASIDVPYVSQYPDLPTGCEITAATMLMNFYGVDVQNTDLADYLNISYDFYYDENYGTGAPRGSGISTSEILANVEDESSDESSGDTSADTAADSRDSSASQESADDTPATDGNVPEHHHHDSTDGLPPDDQSGWHAGTFSENPFEGMIGPDPDEVFIGNPYSDDGLYCNPQPAADALNAYNAANGIALTATALKGYTPAQLYQLVSQGKPVVVWVTLYMGEYPNDLSWKTESGKRIRTTSIDHAMVLTGYDVDADLVYVNDPIDSSSTEYSFEEFEASYALRGNLALVLEPASSIAG